MPNRISHLLALVNILLTLALTAEAQTNPPVECPKITVSGYPGIVDIGREYEFSVKLAGRAPKGVTFAWEIPGAPIVSGKNASVVRFATTPEMNGTSVIAIVRIGGLPAHCTNTGSDFVGVGGGIGPIFLSKTDSLIWESKQLLELFDQLEAFPNNQAYIYIGAKPETERHKEIESVIRESALRNGVDQARLTFVRELTTKEIIEIWRVPPGSDNPICRACERVARPDCGLPFDDYGKISKNDERARLDMAAVAMLNNQTWIAVVILFVSPGESKSAAEKRKAFIHDHLVKTRRAPNERLEVHFARDDESRTSIYLVSPELRSTPRQAFNAEPSFDQLKRKN